MSSNRRLHGRGSRAPNPLAAAVGTPAEPGYRSVRWPGPVSRGRLPRSLQSTARPAAQSQLDVVAPDVNVGGTSKA